MRRDGVAEPGVVADIDQDARCGQRVSIEAGVTFGWERFTGDMGIQIGIDRFGASAPAEVLAEDYGLTRDAILERVRAYLSEA